MNCRLPMFIATCLFGALCMAAEPRRVANGNAVIRAPAGDSEIVLTTTSRLAGAIHSLTWNGKELIDSADHGRQLQSAANFDFGTQYSNETFNPTEAGSMHDGAGDTSTSKLLHMLVTDRTLQSTTQMAFWLRPGEQSGGVPAKNREPLSNHLLTKRVQLGYKNLPHVLQYDVTFSMPLGEQHTYAQFEAVTGYMPAEFDQALVFHAPTGKLEPLAPGTGEQALPIVLTNAAGSHALGVYSPDQPSPGFAAAGYGRFFFPDQRVNKWNCVFRLRAPQPGVPAGDYAFRNFVVLGTKPMVESALRTLHAEFEPRLKE